MQKRHTAVILHGVTAVYTSAAACTFMQMTHVSAVRIQLQLLPLHPDQHVHPLKHAVPVDRYNQLHSVVFGVDC
jgi:hypothetical protein